MTNTTTNIINAMEVICLRKRKNFSTTVKGGKYFVDRNSIYIDSDGDTYGEFYNCEGKYLGKLALKRFQTIRMNYELRIYR